MKKLLIIVGVLAIVCPGMAASISYTENWDSYATGTADANYNANWATVSGMSRYPIINNAGAFSPENTLEQQASAEEPGLALGIENDLADGVEMAIGEVLQATAASPIVAGIYWTPETNDRQQSSFVFELLKGETVVAGMANSKVIDDGNNNPYLWRGAGFWWRYRDTVYNHTGVWNHCWMEITPAAAGGIDILYHINAVTRALWVDVDPAVDTIRISSVAGTITTSWIDDVYINGGEIVPEPATLVLLGFGCLFLRRRRL